MDLQLTAVFRQVPEGYIGFVEEVPGANTQGATLPRHSGINDDLARKICKDLGVPPP